MLFIICKLGEPKTLDMQKSILILVDWFAPAYKAGGIITACKNFALQMSQDRKVFIITSDSDINGEKLEGISSGVWTLYSPNCFVKYVPAGEMKTRLVRETVEAIKPECVYLNSMFSLKYTLLPLWLLLTKKIKCPVNIHTHGMMLPGALNTKGLKKKIFLSLFKLLRIQKKVTLQTNMEEEYNHIKKVLNPPNKNIIKNSLSLGKTEYEFDPAEKAPGYLSLAFLGRVHPIKNLDYALEVLRQIPYTVEFKIIGAVEDELYWKRCRNLIDNLPPNIYVKYYGALPQDEAENIVRGSHGLFLPSQTENFCFAIYEALSNGCPVITSDRTPWRNLEANGVGWDISLDQPEKFRDSIEKLTMMGAGEYRSLSRNAWEYAARYRDKAKLPLVAELAPTHKIYRTERKIA
jgi:glycosyltransferase involved in cell wall biosynthesis